MIATGCIMARVCHTNNCPVGVASQREELRARFPGGCSDQILLREGLVRHLTSRDSAGTQCRPMLPLKTATCLCALHPVPAFLPSSLLIIPFAAYNLLCRRPRRPGQLLPLCGGGGAGGPGGAGPPLPGPAHRPRRPAAPGGGLCIGGGGLSISSGWLKFWWQAFFGQLRILVLADCSAAQWLPCVCGAAACLAAQPSSIDHQPPSLGLPLPLQRSTPLAKTSGLDLSFLTTFAGEIKWAVGSWLEREDVKCCDGRLVPRSPAQLRLLLHGCLCWSLQLIQR